MKLNICLFVVVLIMCSFVFADGNFNEAMTGTVTGNKLVNDPQFKPYIYDFDNDTVNEVLVVDGNILKLYTGSTLEEVDGLTVSCSTINDIEIYDFSDDGYYEIVLACESDDLISVSRYNGTDFSEINTIDLSGLTHDDGEFMLGCGGDKCLLAYSDLQ